MVKVCLPNDITYYIANDVPLSNLVGLVMVVVRVSVGSKVSVGVSVWVSNG